MRPLIHHANPYFRRGGGSTFPKVAAVLQTTQLSTNNNDNNNKCRLPRLRIARSKCNNSNIINNVIRYLLLRDLRGASRASWFRERARYVPTRSLVRWIAHAAAAATPTTATSDAAASAAAAADIPSAFAHALAFIHGHSGRSIGV